MSQSATKEENPLVNILVNVLLPTIVLSKLSKEGSEVYHLGPTYAMIVALVLPMGYGIWHWLKHRTLNIFSAVGMGAILLTGLITIYLWYSESAKAQVGWIFGIKEAIQPLILGSLFLITRRSKNPLFRTFIYNDGLFDIKRIENAVADKHLISEYEDLIWKCTLYFFGSFCLSAVLNLGLAHYFFSDLDPSMLNWKEEYAAIVGKITIWGFIVIAAPMVIVAMYILFMMINGLQKLTGLERDHLMLPR